MTTLTSHNGPVSPLLPRRLPTEMVARIGTGDTAWLLAASALVLLMAPGLALFYGGVAVEICSGASALALAMVPSRTRRRGWWRGTRPLDPGAVAGCRPPRPLLVRSPIRHHGTERLET